ncbi:hypothetical protein RCDURKIN_117 [Rhodobacter phage RcDurkin]|nr:hypothetical protein RCDURKIN_117 [Rhodobacter phage RcDurkin]QXN72586.1 hypothetical protein RCTIPTONUS_116 [Rhodobacter phage RcTiptonus]UUV43860.1 hypothetical protein RCKICKAPOO_119 [Rhodobacter phage RcKickapoo]UUV44487.1 hypothetical protein RCMENCHIE_118 [Rhodobacter phage RcMenchie]
MGFEIHYRGKAATREHRDFLAARDAIHYLGLSRWVTLKAFLRGIKSVDDVQTVVVAMGMAGIAGLPVRALLRRYALPHYIKWCASPLGGCPVEVDEEGYAVHE